MVATEGFPVGYEILDGNMLKKQTLAQMIQGIEAYFGKADQVWRWTGGISTAEQLNDLRANAPPPREISGEHASLPRLKDHPCLGVAALDPGQRFGGIRTFHGNEWALNDRQLSEYLVGEWILIYCITPVFSGSQILSNGTSSSAASRNQVGTEPRPLSSMIPRDSNWKASLRRKRTGSLT